MNNKTMKDKFNEFIESEQTSGIILIICAAVALIISNSSAQHIWFDFWEIEIGPSFLNLKKSILHWINDGLMAIFFLLVGLEIKRELVEGELSTFKKALLPIIAAVGGMLVPAIIYTIFNYGSSGSSGWGIPMATDIAFALGVLALLGKKVPFSLKILLTALAVVDDMGAIIVIAIFYSDHLALYYLIGAGAIFFILILINRAGITNILIYLLLGIILWFCTLKSGIHATIAGVLFALTIPLGKGEENSLAEKIEHFLHKPVNYFIMPLFALANTGFILHGDVAQVIGSTVSIGVFLGLVLGKPIGIFLFTWTTVKFKITEMPSNSNWLQVLGLGFLGGVGFTMSIFISLLAFTQEEFQAFSKIAILTASIGSGILGYLILRATSKN